MKVRFALLSICPCGHPVLKEDIKLGTIYDLDPRYSSNRHFVCGGCNRHQKVDAVWVTRDGKSGWLPAQIFDPI